MEMISTGIDGFDGMLGGGFPKNHAVVVMGLFGTGKTSFALQFTWKGLIDGEKCIFITLEEDVDSIIKSAKSFGWDLGPYIDQEKLALIKLEPADAKATITRLKSELPSFIKSFGAKRVVIDSISLLNMMFDNERERRDHLFNLCRQIKETGANILFTAEVKADNPQSSRDGLVEYVADGVILLEFNKLESNEVQLTIRVVKMRRMKHSRRIKPYSITDEGLVVHSEADIF